MPHDAAHLPKSPAPPSGNSGRSVVTVLLFQRRSKRLRLRSAKGGLAVLKMQDAKLGTRSSVPEWSDSDTLWKFALRVGPLWLRNVPLVRRPS